MKWSVGLMTGTVLDGNIDIAPLRTDGETITELGPWTLADYAPETQALLARNGGRVCSMGVRAREEAEGIRVRGARPVAVSCCRFGGHSP